MKAKIPHPLWARHLRSFSEIHRGWLVRLDGLEGGSGELPLEALEITPRGVVVRLDKDRFTRVIADPIAIDEVKRADGAVESLIVKDRDDQRWYVTFHAVLAPEHVDGAVADDQLGFRDRSVRIPTSQSVVLDGDLSVPERCIGMVCFAHGSGSGRHSERNRFVARELQKARIGTLLIDLLTPEEESIDVRTGHLRFDIALLADRLIAASDWLTQHGATRRLPIGYYGASTGGGAALVAAAWRSNIRAVVSRGGRPDLARDALKRIRCPVSLMVGAYDVQVMELNQQALSVLRCDKELVIVPHATHLFPEPGALEEVARGAERWFSRWLPYREHMITNA